MKDNRILIFSLAYHPSHVSGAEAAVYEITSRINDIEFHLITLLFDPHAPRNEKIGNVQVYRVGSGGSKLSKILFIPRAIWKARSLHKELHFNAMWSVMTYMLFPVVLSKWAGVSIPHVLTLQDGDPYERVFKRWFVRPVTPILDYGFRHAKAIQAISAYLAEWPKRRGATAPIEVIHNGANPRDIRAEFDQGEIDALKEKLGKKEGDVFLINTARLVHQKGADTTIRALAHLPEHVKLVLVGGGAQEAELKGLVRELNLEERVIFTGLVERTEVSNYRQAADIFVGPSRSEGLGNAFLSAMASRLPVIATQVGGIAEFLFDEKRDPNRPTTGWAVDPDEPEQIAEKVLEILEHPEHREQVTTTARAMVLEKFDWDIIAKQMRERVFARVL